MEALEMAEKAKKVKVTEREIVKAELVKVVSLMLSSGSIMIKSIIYQVRKFPALAC